jgi:hypothetical protein
MTIEIEIQSLVNFETATDGTAVKLIVTDIADREIGIILKIETLTALLMTLPAMASSAVKRAHNDPSMRITYPLREFEIEFAPAHSDGRNSGRVQGLFQPHRGSVAGARQGSPRRRGTTRQNPLAAGASAPPLALTLSSEFQDKNRSAAAPLPSRLRSAWLLEIAK